MPSTELDLDALTLAHGSHRSPDDGLCVMEAVAYLAREPHSDHPSCASKVVTAFAMSLNDRWSDDQRQKLVPLIPAIVGTRTSEADEQTRAWMATDWLVRTYTPAWLRLAGLDKQADLLVGLGPQVGPETVPPIKPTLEAVRADAAAAGAAARDAAGDAARDAAWAAARDAARDAAWAAAGDALAPTVSELQSSALDLLARMCQVGRDEVAS